MRVIVITKLSLSVAVAVVAVAVALLSLASTPGSAQSPRNGDAGQQNGRNGKDAGPDPANGARRSGKPGEKSGRSAKATKPIPKVMRRPGASAVPEGASQRAALLRELYTHLATTDDENAAKRITNAIEHVWKAATGTTIDLLMARAAKAAAGDDRDLAIELLDRAVKLAPDATEVFYRRAMVHYANEDFNRSAGDLRRVLALDANHYKALEGLAQIFKETERKKAALAVYRQLYKIYPANSAAKSAADELTREIEGQPS